LVPELRTVQHPHHGRDEGRHSDATTSKYISTFVTINLPYKMLYMVVQRSKNVCIYCIEWLRMKKSKQFNGQCVVVTIGPVAGNQNLHELAELTPNFC